MADSKWQWKEPDAPGYLTSIQPHLMNHHPLSQVTLNKFLIDSFLIVKSEFSQLAWNSFEIFKSFLLFTYLIWKSVI